MSENYKTAPAPVAPLTPAQQHADAMYALLCKFRARVLDGLDFAYPLGSVQEVYSVLSAIEAASKEKLDK